MRHKKLLTLFVVLALAVVAAAVAAWLISTPATNGRGKVGTLAAPTCSASATFTGTAGQLAPGGDGDAQLTCTNPNSIPLTMVSAGDNGGGSFASAGCAPANFSFHAGGSTVATPQVLPANATNVSFVITGLFHLSASAPSTCQGADVVQTGGVVINWSS